MSDAERLAALLFDTLGWAKRYNPQRETTLYCGACGRGDFATYDPLPDGILSGDRDNPAWSDLAARLIAAGVSIPPAEPCNVEPAFSQHEYAVDYCETHDRPASECAAPPAEPRASAPDEPAGPGEIAERIRKVERPDRTPTEDAFLRGWDGGYRLAESRRAEPRAEGLRDFFQLRPHGTVGPDKVPWFIHCGIAHGEGAECVVCAALATPPQQAALDVERLARALHTMPHHYRGGVDESLARMGCEQDGMLRCRERAASLTRAYADQEGGR